MVFQQKIREVHARHRLQREFRRNRVRVQQCPVFIVFVAERLGRKRNMVKLLTVREGNEPFQRIALKPVVAVDKVQVVAFGQRNARVAGDARPLVFLPDEFEPIVLLCILLQNVRTAVRRTVVDADDFDVFLRLPSKRVEAFAKVSLGVIDWNDYRNGDDPLRAHRLGLRAPGAVRFCHHFLHGHIIS